MVFPMAVSPLPSGPWQVAHLALYTSAAASAANVEVENANVTARTTNKAGKTVFMLFLS
jgi:hypothetical protein